MAVESVSVVALRCAIHFSRSSEMAATFDNGFFDFVGTMFIVLAIAGVCLMLLTVGSGLLFTGIHRRLRQARERAGG